MKLVILDGYSTNPGDLSWSQIEQFGNVQIYDRTPQHLVVDRAKDAEVILTNKTEINELHLRQLPSLKLICLMSTGYDVVDISAARSAGIGVANVRGYSTTSVVQHTFALILELQNQVSLYAEQVRSGKWHQSKDFSFWDRPIIELQGKKLGIVGFGNIGKAVARVGHAFGMEVLVAARPSISANEKDISVVDLNELFAESDIVSLHCPLTESNRRFVNKSLLDLMKPSAVIVNTARGPLIDENDLIQALKNNDIKAAALDVLNQEPPAIPSELFELVNCLITPHQAWASLESRKRLIEALSRNIQSYQDGAPINIVN